MEQNNLFFVSFDNEVFENLNQYEARRLQRQKGGSILDTLDNLEEVKKGNAEIDAGRKQLYEERIVKLAVFINDTLGYKGRMISGSKSYYRQMRPDNIAIFNANICNSKQVLWCGDVDITLDIEKLVKIAEKACDNIFILHEFDASLFEKPVMWQKAIATFYHDGAYTISDETKEYYPKFVCKERKSY